MKKTRLMRKCLKKDKRGEMGIGTMILFIAMVLVAAIAAALLITTASQLNQRAQETGTTAEQEVSTGMMMRNIQGDRLINGEGPNGEMPTLDNVAPSAPDFDVTPIQDGSSTGTNHYYGYKISISSVSSDAKAGVMKEQLFRSDDGVIDSSDTLVKTTTYLAENLLTTSSTIYDAPTQSSSVASTDNGAGVFYYYFKVYDRAGNSVYSSVITDSSASSKLLSSDYTVTSVNETNATITIDENSTASGLSENEFVGYGLIIDDTGSSESYVYPIIDMNEVSDGSGGYDMEISIDPTDLTDISFISTGSDDINIIGLDRRDTQYPMVPTLTSSGEFKAISQGASSGKIVLELTGLDLSGEIDAIDEVNGTALYWGSDGPTSKINRIKGFNIYRIQGTKSSDGNTRPPNVVPVGFWDINDFTETTTGIFESIWVDYIQMTNGDEKTAYSYAIAAVDLTGNEENSYHVGSDELVGDALWTSEACATSCTADITLPTWNTYSITATSGSSAITISWTAASTPSDVGSGISSEDFQGQVNNQANEHYAFEIWRGLEPIFDVNQLPVGGSVNPLVTLAGYARSSDTSFEDYGIQWNTVQKKGFEGNVYYYAVCAVDNAGNRILKPGLSDNIEVIEMKAALQAGSPGVDFDLVKMELTDGQTAADLTFGGLGEPSDATASTFVVQVIRDVDGDFVRGNVLTQGSIVKIIVNCDALGLDIQPQTHVSLSIMPKHGNPTRESFTTPSTYVDRYVELL